MHKEKINLPSSIAKFAMVSAVVGGVGAALYKTRKGKEVASKVCDLGDEMVDAFERALDSVEKKSSVHEDSPEKLAAVFTHFWDELKDLNDSAEDVTTQSPVKQIVQKVKKEAPAVVEEVEEGLGESIAWFQKKARSLARKM